MDRRRVRGSWTRQAESKDLAVWRRHLVRGEEIADGLGLRERASGGAGVCEEKTGVDMKYRFLLLGDGLGVENSCYHSLGDLPGTE